MRSHLLHGLLVSAALSLAVASALVPAAVAPAAAADDLPAVASPEPLPTVQIDGVVWDQAVVGDTVYAVGSFTSARPAGSAAGENEVPRANALAYDIKTGALLDWAPTTNGVINTIEASKDGSLLYLGGGFTELNGETTWRVGSVTAAGAERKPVAASANTSVRDLAVSPDGGTLYVVGDFSQINSSARHRVAAVDLTTQTLTDFAPVVSDYGVRAVAVSEDGGSVAIGGSFTAVNGSNDPGEGLAILEKDGTLRPNEINSVIAMSGDRSGIMGLESDSRGLYGVSYSRRGLFEGMFRADWDTGRIALMADCHGDSYDVHPVNRVVYVASHTHDCSNIGSFSDQAYGYRHAVAYVNEATRVVQHNQVPDFRDYGGNPGTTILGDFLPEFRIGTVTGTNQATWTVEGNEQYLVYGGEFLAVAGVPQQGLVRFAMPAPDGDGGKDGGGNNDNGNGNGKDGGNGNGKDGGNGNGKDGGNGNGKDGDNVAGGAGGRTDGQGRKTDGQGRKEGADVPGRRDSRPVRR